MSDEVSSFLESGVLTLIINRPDQRNALNLAVMKSLGDALCRAGEDRGVRVVTLTGAGDKVFCAGADLKSTLSGETSPDAFTPAAYHELLLQILKCPKPTVALARGHVMAGGLGLFVASDFALACDDVHFSTPEILVGMFPMMLMALLRRQAGRRRAVEMAFLGERISAATALEYGIVNHIYARGDFEIEADRFVRMLTEKSAAILRLGKQALLEVEGRDLAEELEYLKSALSGVMSCADSREGMRAFVEKRKPHWKEE